MAFNWEPPKPRTEMARPRVPRCKGCGSTNIEDDPTSGDRACQNCGVVQQENGIVSTVQFSESGGSSNVVGQFVSGDKGRPSGGGAGRGRGRFGHSRDSRETTIQNGKKKIIQVACVEKYGVVNSQPVYICYIDYRNVAVRVFSPDAGIERACKVWRREKRV